MPFTVSVYSPSAGNSCSISMPPRVPNGRPSTYSFWLVSCGASNTASVGAVSVPMARRLMLPAADRYASINAGDVVSVPAMLSKP